MVASTGIVAVQSIWRKLFLKILLRHHCHIWQLIATNLIVSQTTFSQQQLVTCVDIYKYDYMFYVPVDSILSVLTKLCLHVYLPLLLENTILQDSSEKRVHFFLKLGCSINRLQMLTIKSNEQMIFKQLNFHTITISGVYFQLHNLLCWTRYSVFTEVSLHLLSS